MGRRPAAPVALCHYALTPPAPHTPSEPCLVYPATPFPKSFTTSIKQIFRRLFRVFVHVYYHHFDKLTQIGAVGALGGCLVVGWLSCACMAPSPAFSPPGGTHQHMLQALLLLCQGVQADRPEGARAAGAFACLLFAPAFARFFLAPPLPQLHLTPIGCPLSPTAEGAYGDAVRLSTPLNPIPRKKKKKQRREE